MYSYILVYIYFFFLLHECDTCTFSPGLYLSLAIAGCKCRNRIARLVTYSRNLHGPAATTLAKVKSTVAPKDGKYEVAMPYKLLGYDIL